MRQKFRQNCTISVTVNHFSGAGVPPAVFRKIWSDVDCRRDAGATEDSADNEDCLARGARAKISPVKGGIPHRSEK
jgi:hypothetical protein